MTSLEFNSLLFSRFPELRAEYEAKHSYMGNEDPGCYLTFEGVLVPAIERAAADDSVRLDRLMGFVEEIAKDEPGLVSIGLGEWLSQSKHSDDINRVAGERTKLAIFKTERSLVRAERDHLSSPLQSLLWKLIMPTRRSNVD